MTLRRLGAAVVLTLVGVLAVAAPAGAHARLVATSPEAGSTVPASPQELRLEFNEPVDIAPGAIRLFDAAGRQIDLPEATRLPADPKVVVARPPELGRGSYVVAWRAVSTDAHPINGAFTFSVIEPGASTRNLVEQLVNEQGSTTVGVLFAVVRWLGFLAVLFLVGAALFIAVCLPDGADAAKVRRWLMLAVVLGIVTSVLAIGFQGAYATGSGIGQVFSPGSWADVVGTRFGRAQLMRVVFLLGWLPVALRPTVLATLPGRMLAGAGSVALAVTVAESGHAVTGRWPLAAWVADVVHVLAAGVWVGGLVALVSFALGDPERALRAARRYSTTALVAVVVVTLSGALQSVRQVGDWSALTSTTYGRLLMVKVGMVLVVVAVAWVSRSILRLAPGDGVADSLSAGLDEDERGEGSDEVDDPDGVDPADEVLSSTSARGYLRRSVAVEVAGVITVLVVTTLLTSVIPAREAQGLPVEQTVVAEGGFAQILVDPARANVESSLHVTVTNPDGTLPDLRGVVAELRLPERDIGPLEVTLDRISLNHFVNEAVVFPFPGTWEITAKVAVSEFRDETFTLTVPVR